jgi:hypothetical protein
MRCDRGDLARGEILADFLCVRLRFIFVECECKCKKSSVSVLYCSCVCEGDLR